MEGWNETENELQPYTSLFLANNASYVCIFWGFFQSLFGMFALSEVLAGAADIVGVGPRVAVEPSCRTGRYGERDDPQL